MALTANANVDRFIDQELREFPVGAAVHVYRGARVGLDPAGYLKPFVPGDLFTGISYEESDNSAGAAAAKKCRVYVVGDFELTITGVALTDADAPVFATGDDAQGLTGHPDAFMGRVVHYLTTNTALVRLREWGEKPPNGVGSIDIGVDFARQVFAALDEGTATSVVLGGLLKTACIGAGLTAGTTGLLLNEAAGALRMLLDNDDEAQNLTIETPQVFNITKGMTFEAQLTLEAAGGAATDDLDFGIMGLAGGITATERADMDAATAGLLSAKFHVDANGLDLKFSSDDNASPVAATDTQVNIVLQTYNKFKAICRPAGTVEVWVDGVRKLSTAVFSVGAAGLLAGIVNIEKSTGTGVPEVRVKKLRMAGAMA